jgi:hypothetical protein
LEVKYDLVSVQIQLDVLKSSLETIFSVISFHLFNLLTKKLDKLDSPTSLSNVNIFSG